MLTNSPKELAVAAVNQRKMLGLSQSEIAERIGLKQKTISAFENNPENTMLSTAFLILSGLHLDLKVEPKDSKFTTEWDQEW